MLQLFYWALGTLARHVNHPYPPFQWYKLKKPVPDSGTRNLHEKIDASSSQFLRFDWSHHSPPTPPTIISSPYRSEAYQCRLSCPQSLHLSFKNHSNEVQTCVNIHFMLTNSPDCFTFNWYGLLIMASVSVVPVVTSIRAQFLAPKQLSGQSLCTVCHVPDKCPKTADHRRIKVFIFYVTLCRWRTQSQSVSQ